MLASDTAAIAQALQELAALRQRGLPVEPYWAWALASGFAGFRPLDPSSRIPFAVQLKPERVVTDLSDLPGLVWPAVYEQPLPDRLRARCVTVRCPLAAVGRLLAHAAVERIELGLPQQQHAVPADAPAAPPSLPAAAVPRAAAGGSVLLGLIDHGFAFLHPRFVKRLLAVWDQEPDVSESPRWGPTGAQGWSLPQPLGYGRQLNAADLKALKQAFASDEAGYRHAAYPPALQRRSHGTQVMDLAAGEPAPEAAVARPDLVAVQLPWRNSKDTSGASLCVHVLDGLHYILQCATPGQRVVVNISDGAMAGSHNGSSILEEAMDALIAQVGPAKLAVVIAAGNAHEARCHAHAIVPPGGTQTLSLRLLPDDSSESFVELWFDGPALRVEVQPPAGLVQGASPDGDVFWRATGPAGQVPWAGLFNWRGVPNGRRAGRLADMALLALGPTVAPAGRPRAPAPHGLWTIRVNNPGSTAVGFNAWIERDDPPYPDTGPRRQPRFVSAGRLDAPGNAQIPLAQLPAHVTRQGTLNSIATGKATIVVAAHRLADGVLADYSAAGGLPADAARDGPDVSAAAEESAVLHGRRVAANRPGGTARLDGTSAAAPLVARTLVTRSPKSMPSATPQAVRGQASKVWPAGAPGAGPLLELQRQGGGWLDVPVG